MWEQMLEIKSQMRDMTLQLWAWKRNAIFIIYCKRDKVPQLYSKSCNTVFKGRTRNANNFSCHYVTTFKWWTSIHGKKSFFFNKCFPSLLNQGPILKASNDALLVLCHLANIQTVHWAQSVTNRVGCNSELKNYLFFNLWVGI